MYGSFHPPPQFAPAAPSSTTPYDRDNAKIRPLPVENKTFKCRNFCIQVRSRWRKSVASAAPQAWGRKTSCIVKLLGSKPVRAEERQWGRFTFSRIYQGMRTTIHRR